MKKQTEVSTKIQAHESGGSKTKEKAEEPFSLEEGFSQLDGLIKDMEEGDQSLEEIFASYQKGMELLKKCTGEIDLIEKKVLALNEEGELNEF